MTIHYATKQNQIGVYYACGKQSMPALKQSNTLPANTYIDTDGDTYSFRSQYISCSHCRSAMNAIPEPTIPLLTEDEQHCLGFDEEHNHRKAKHICNEDCYHIEEG
jgi:hypothetical protein